MSSPTETLQRWICESCGFIYDPEEGDPDGGIPAGTAFEQSPTRGSARCAARASATSCSTRIERLADRSEGVLARSTASTSGTPTAALPGAAAPLPVVSAEGVRLRLADGRELIDGMASWWCAIHGYRHPRARRRRGEQLGRMAHVMFGGLTHEPAIRLAERLRGVAPAGLERVFFADSGSVSVEVALKMCLQFQRASGRPRAHAAADRPRRLPRRHGRGDVRLRPGGGDAPSVRRALLAEPCSPSARPTASARSSTSVGRAVRELAEHTRASWRR